MFANLFTTATLRRGQAFLKAEWNVLLVLGLASGLVFGFLHLADEVVEGETQRFDEAVLMLFRDPGDVERVIGPAWFHEAARDITALGSYACLSLILAGVVTYLLLASKRMAALLMLVSVLGGMLLSTVLKIGFNRPRPDLSPIAETFTSSFPSGHATLSAVTFLTLGALGTHLVDSASKKIFAISVALFMTLLVGVSRLYLGVHYPSDILAGWSLGAAWALFCSGIAVLLQRSGTVEEAGEVTATRKS